LEKTVFPYQEILFRHSGQVLTVSKSGGQQAALRAKQAKSYIARIDSRRALNGNRLTAYRPIP
jgi:hypothetical protein